MTRFILKILSILYLIAASNDLFAASEQIVKLPHLNIDPSTISISGVSSGGFMAVQMQVAYSHLFKGGVGVIAGGPYYCAEGKAAMSIFRCMKNYSQVPVDKLVKITNKLADSGSIDPLSNLKGEKVYLFSGLKDTVVNPNVMGALNEYYHHFIPDNNIKYTNTIKTEHAMITDGYGNSCLVKGSPYINNCNFDLAGQLLSFLYGKLKPRNEKELGGKYIAFDQSGFLTGHGLGKVGYLYVPKNCSDGQLCKLHVALHGCLQNVSFVGDKLYRYSGFNKWADTNNLVVLYPQTGEAAIQGCWDWWGYDDPNYAVKSGRQMQALKKMIDQIISK